MVKHPLSVRGRASQLAELPSQEAALFSRMQSSNMLCPRRLLSGQRVSSRDRSVQRGPGAAAPLVDDGVYCSLRSW